MDTSRGWDFLVDRADLGRRAVRDIADPADPADGEVLLRVDAFALTANNLTYAVTADRFGYWQLFPAKPGWGRIPAWGIATVERSSCGDVAVGERFTGMVPMSTYVYVRPRPTRDGFADCASHRARVNPVYNRYVRVTGRDDNLERDAALRPVIILSFVLAEYLRATAWRGAGRLLVTSASSKAALGLAHIVQPEDVTVVGLTSPRHRARIEAIGCFDEVVDYENVDRLPGAPSTVLVDIAGRRAVRDTLATRLGPSLLDTVHVGQTDWEQPADQLLGNSNDPATTAFFAPTVIEQLVAEWGAAQFAQRFDDVLRGFAAQSSQWLTVDHRDGRAAMSDAFGDVAAGAIAPDRFVVVRPHGARLGE